ncbi:hypothetical protein GGX14DRAFT_564624 [Mycena pura]|uniref:DUF6534 domain-containing protein n=1 Tax=Mycena pura TaxID=153505 RepID=A0AAD6VG78_9AGAR|nr:hypothetical protein GGX14DRAFT_564624 [Mycena pura]
MASLMLPTFDGTLGSLFIGLNLTTVLYGVTIVQTFMYITSERTKKDSWALKGLVFLNFHPSTLQLALSRNKVLDTGHQVSTSMGLYRFLITDYLNPLQLSNTKLSGGANYIHTEAIFGTLMTLLVQLFYAWRVYAFSTTLSKRTRLLLAMLTISLALLTFSVSMAIFVRTFPTVHTGPSVFTPTAQDATDWKMQLPSAMACDIVITLAMVYNLHISRSGLGRTDHVLNILIMFSVNTGLLTVLLSTASLICFLVLPQNVLAYVAMEMVIPKCYTNSFLATLNSREFLSEMISPNVSLSGILPSSKLQTLQFDANPASTLSYSSGNGTNGTRADLSSSGGQLVSYYQ